MIAAAEVLEIAEDGSVSRMKLAMERLMSFSPDRELAARGTEIIVVFKNRVATFPFDAPLPSDDVQIAISTLLTVAEGLDLDVLFGGAPRTADEKWGVDVQAFLATLGEGAALTVTGKAKTTGLVDSPGAPCLDISLTLTTRGPSETAEWTLSGNSEKSFAIDVKMPTDPALPILSITEESESSVESDGAGGPGGAFSMKSAKSVTTTVELPASQ
jgi:hypothetical protein